MGKSTLEEVNLTTVEYLLMNVIITSLQIINMFLCTKYTNEQNQINKENWTASVDVGIKLFVVCFCCPFRLEWV